MGMLRSTVPALVSSMLLLGSCGSTSEQPVGAGDAATTTSPALENGEASTTTSVVEDRGVEDSIVATTSTPTTAPPPTTVAPSTTTRPTVATGVRGQVTAGPTCPVERPDQPCPPTPVSGRVDAIDADDETAGSTTTDDDGRYELVLSPGDYTLRVDTPGQFPTCPDVDVTVTSGSPVAVDIDCDTGIR